MLLAVSEDKALVESFSKPDISDHLLYRPVTCQYYIQCFSGKCINHTLAYFKTIKDFY